MKLFQDKDLRLVVGRLLRAGVLVAMAIVIAGLVLFLFQQGKDPAAYSVFHSNAVFDPALFWRGLWHGESTAVMSLGIMVLIATPVLRVLFSMIGFLLEKDYLYTIIAFAVLCIILLSMIYGAVE